VIFEFFHQLEHLLGPMAGNYNRIICYRVCYRMREPRGPAISSRVADRIQLVGDVITWKVSPSLVTSSAPGLERELEQLVLVDRGDFSIPMMPRFFEHPADASNFAEVPAATREDEAQLRDRAIAIVRQHVNHYRDAAGAVAFVRDFLERTRPRFRRLPFLIARSMLSLASIASWRPSPRCAGADWN